MTNEKLVELLRETKWYLTIAKKALALAGTEDVLARTNAALAELTNPTTDVVGPEVEWDRVNAQFFVAYPDNETSLTVSRVDPTRQEWRWDMEREVKKKGYCVTEAEAKEAAVEAARGLR